MAYLIDQFAGRLLIDTGTIERRRFDEL